MSDEPFETDEIKKFAECVAGLEGDPSVETEVVNGEIQIGVGDYGDCILSVEVAKISLFILNFSNE